MHSSGKLKGSKHHFDQSYEHLMVVFYYLEWYSIQISSHLRSHYIVINNRRAFIKLAADCSDMLTWLKLQFELQFH